MRQHSRILASSNRQFTLPGGTGRSADGPDGIRPSPGGNPTDRRGTAGPSAAVEPVGTNRTATGRCGSGFRSQPAVGVPLRDATAFDAFTTPDPSPAGPKNFLTPAKGFGYTFGVKGGFSFRFIPTKWYRQPAGNGVAPYGHLAGLENPAKYPWHPSKRHLDSVAWLDGVPTTDPCRWRPGRQND